LFSTSAGTVTSRVVEEQPQAKTDQALVDLVVAPVPSKSIQPLVLKELADQARARALSRRSVLQRVGVAVARSVNASIASPWFSRSSRIAFTTLRSSRGDLHPHGAARCCDCPRQFAECNFEHASCLVLGARAQRLGNVVPALTFVVDVDGGDPARLSRSR